MARNDHFSGFAATYASFRPTYPAELFAVLSELAPSREHAWDCATGNGQAALSLAEHFNSVTATDIGGAMIKHAMTHPRVSYAVGAAETAAVGNGTVDLVTVAQALHWFDRPAFWRTCQRVLKPNGVLAFWGYLLPRINPAVDAIINYYHADTVGPYWPPDRGPLMNLYADIDPPAERVLNRDFTMTTCWTVDHLIGMLDSWSATHRARKETGHDPLPAAAGLLKVVWGTEAKELPVQWPLKVHAFRFNSPP